MIRGGSGNNKLFIHITFEIYNKRWCHLMYLFSRFGCLSLERINKSNNNNGIGRNWFYFCLASDFILFFLWPDKFWPHLICERAMRLKKKHLLQTSLTSDFRFISFHFGHRRVGVHLTITLLPFNCGSLWENNNFPFSDTR